MGSWQNHQSDLLALPTSIVLFLREHSNHNGSSHPIRIHNEIHCPESLVEWMQRFQKTAPSSYRTRGWAGHNARQTRIRFCVRPSTSKIHANDDLSERHQCGRGQLIPRRSLCSKADLLQHCLRVLQPTEEQIQAATVAEVS